MGSKSRITEEAFREASLKLSCEVAAIKAVAEVESAGAGFLTDGTVKILFERHQFHKFTKGKYSGAHPDISNPTRGGYAKGKDADIRGQREWARFQRAHELDSVAAMKSASWGKFQIMGFNYEAAGYSSVAEFVAAMSQSEDRQLEAFVNFVIANGLADELRRKDWAGFAKRYNGPAYKENKYDTKMAAAYAKYKKSALKPAEDQDEPEENEEPIIIPVTEPIPEPEPAKEQTKDSGLTTSPGKTAEETEGTPPPAKAMEVKASRPSFKSIIAALLAAATGPLTALGIEPKDLAPWAKANLGWAIKLVCVFLFFALAAWIWNKAMERANQRTLKVMDAAKEKNDNNLRLV